MFAGRRCFFSLEKLPCFNIAFLTCWWLLVVGHVSSMSLNRHGRVNQQLNDKQLQLSEFMLPEAESEILQNDMELVPANDDNSDMYLLVPATVASKEQNFQTVTDLNETVNSDNVERNSDMLMQESEDAPVAQILKLPEDDLETKIRQDLVTNNELDQEFQIGNDNNEQVSESVHNIIAEAGPEIQNEFVESEENAKTEELIQAEQHKQQVMSSSSDEFSEEHKYIEVENAQDSATEHINSEQEEMIGVAKDETIEAATTEVSPETDNSQLDLQLESSEVEPFLAELFPQSQEKTSDENASGIEKIETAENTPELEMLHDKKDKNEKFEEILAMDEHVKSEEPEVVIDPEEEKIKTSIETQVDDEAKNQQDMQAADEISSETQDVDKDQAIKNPQDLDDSQIIAEEIKHVDEESLNVEDETNVKEHQDEETKDNETEENHVLDIQAEKNPSDAETQVQYISSASQTQSVDSGQPATNPENPAESTIDDNKSSTETEPDYESQYLESTPISTDNKSDETKQDEQTSAPQTLEEFNKIEEDKATENDSKVPEPNRENEVQSIYEEDQKNEKVQYSEQTQQGEEIQGGEEIPYVEDKGENNGQIETAKENEVQSATETIHEDADYFQSNKEVVKETESNEDEKYVEESQIAEDVQYADKFQMTEDIENIKDVLQEEVLPVQELANADQTLHNKESEEIQPTENTNELTHIISNSPINEEFNPLDEPKFGEESQTVEEGQINEDVQTLDNVQSIHDVKVETEPFEENKVDTEKTDAIDAPPSIHSQEIQQSENQEFISEQQDSESDEIIPLENVTVKIEYEIPNEQEEEANPDQSDAFNNENTAQNAVAETVKPLEDKNTHNADTNESETPLNETISMLTTIVQVPTNEEQALQQQHQDHNEELTQQPQQEHEQSQEHQPTFVATIISTNNISQQINEEQIFNSKLRRYDGAQVWRIVVQNDRERKLADELQFKYDGQLWKEVKQEVDYLLKPQVLAEAEKYVRAANLSRIVLIENLQKVIEVENPPAEEIAQLQNRKGYRLTWKAYHRLEDIHGYFDYLAKTYPDICSVEIIGYSIEKRPLKILKISNGNDNNTAIWIDGGMHAREWISPAVVTYITNQIVEGWDDLPAYMRQINWYVHAVANPDGYEYSHTTDRLWRKNMRPHGRACPGVDLNRNFGYKWGGKGTSANPCAQTYRGSKAFSEPETFYISKFISNFPRETFKGSLSFHSYGQYILYPWGYDYHMAKDMPDLDLVARQAGTIITKSTGAKFTVGSSATTLYPAAGGSDDWAKGIAGIKYAYTIEMGDTGRYGFVLPAEYIEPNGKNGLTVAQTVARAITMGKNSRRRKLKAHKNKQNAL